MSTASESADSLLSLINDILDFSKIEAGKLQLEQVDFELREEIGAALKPLGVRAHAKKLELAWRVDADAPCWVSGDPVRLRQILTNLIGNAIKFTESGEVVLDVQLPEPMDDHVALKFSIRDTGVGVAPEQASRIFDAFQQADTSTTRQYGGTGLGLAITSRIVQAMGGRIELESVPGQGSTFQITIHLRPSSQPHPLRKTPDLSNQRVLLVDDNATSRKILIELLGDWGADVEAVDNAAAAMWSLQTVSEGSSPLPLMICDQCMPGIDGLSLIERVRAESRLRETRCILLTSGLQPNQMQRCEELGVSSHLMKPVKHSELSTALQTALGSSRTAADIVPSPSDDKSIRLPPLKILLAEDGKANQKMAVGLLEKWGHQVDVAANGDEAVASWRQRSFDLILMDVQMPVRDGLEATRMIREEERATSAHIPIVAMTAHAMKGDRERCVAAGMDDYVAKPVRKGDLYRALKVFFPPIAAEAPVDDVKDESIVVVNWTEALRNVGGDRDLLLEVIHITLEQMPMLLQDLDVAISSGDGKAAQRLAHTVHGESRALAAKHAETLASRIEAAAARQDLRAAGRDVPKLREAVAQLTADCRDFLDSFARDNKLIPATSPKGTPPTQPTVQPDGRNPG